MKFKFSLQIFFLWHAGFFVVVWCLWNCRNKKIFEDIKPNIYSSKAWISSAMKDANFLITGLPVTRRMTFLSYITLASIVTIQVAPLLLKFLGIFLLVGLRLILMAQPKEPLVSQVVAVFSKITEVLLRDA